MSGRRASDLLVGNNRDNAAARGAGLGGHHGEHHAQSLVFPSSLITGPVA